jgi:hypothetical protein
MEKTSYILAKMKVALADRAFYWDIQRSLGYWQANPASGGGSVFAFGLLLL